jgi:hypothetical protein
MRDVYQMSRPKPKMSSANLHCVKIGFDCGPAQIHWESCGYLPENAADTFPNFANCPMRGPFRYDTTSCVLRDEKTIGWACHIHL